MKAWINPPVVEETTIAESEATYYDASANSVAMCESGGDYSTNTGNGYSGAYQFADTTWQAAGGSTQSAYQASAEEQDAVFQDWYAQHPEAWPNC